MGYSRSLLFTGIVGNILEWYDFIIYGYFASQFAKLFFPASDPVVSLILSFSTFAMGFFARPIGAFFIGYLGDRKGRKPALLVSIILMAIPSFLIIFLPTYETIGILAPILLTLLRLLQGFSAGGEYTTSIAFLLEHSSPDKRGLWSSVNLFGAILGILLGSLSATLLHSVLDQTSLERYGWRLAYLPTIFLALVGYVIRKHTYETPAFLKAQLSPLRGFPLMYALKHCPRSFFLTILLSMVQGVAFYILFVYFPTYFSRYLKLSADQALISNTLAMALLCALILPCAYLSDRIGRKPLLVFSLSLYAGLSFWLNKLLTISSFKEIVFIHLLFALISGFFMSILPVTLAELFPVKIRSTSLAVLYNVSLAIFGGTAPMLATYLVEKVNLPLFPGLYLSLTTAFVFLIVLIFLPETHPLKSKGIAQRS
ncbi:MAG: MFS transporter [Caldimicrobium sp.]|nr:MFS transporter [Caldimicrobium sp.]MCX7873053.1 MFS transporter [Caldimicrobium sp.]MDW8094806.1 MFS transporter [Caldimicrobium sp.]